jgi:ABC-type transport system involved in multi-copper enzyme maturation permease subunit
MTNAVVSSLTLAPDQQSVSADLVRSEWAKFRTVRSTYWSLIAAVTAMVGLGAIISSTQSGHQIGFDPVSNSLSGVLLAQLAIGVLGVLFVTSEYSTGMIRTTFTAAPQRRSVIAVKAAVFAAVALAVGTVTSLVSFLVGQAVMSNGVSLTSPGALRSVIGVGLYLGLLAVFAVGLGTIIRSTAGAIASVFGLILVLPAIAAALPTSIRDSVDKYLPGNAGQAIFHTIRDTSTLSPWAGLGVFALYAAAALASGLVLVGRRDV